jgi:integrase
MRVKDGFVFRDLRSTCKTLMARAGIDIVYRDALLGHVQRGMDRHYMDPDFEKDLRRSMEKWTLWLACEIEINRIPKKEFVDQIVDQ